MVGSRTRRPRFGGLSATVILDSSFVDSIRWDVFVLDFYCAELRLAIEVDGRQHLEAEGLARDAARTEALRQQGIRVVRFTNHEVLTESDAVAEAIWLACQTERE